MIKVSLHCSLLSQAPDATYVRDGHHILGECEASVGVRDSIPNVKCLLLQKFIATHMPVLPVSIWITQRNC